MVFLVVNVNGGDNVFFGDGAGNAVTLLIQPLDGLDVGLDDLLVLAKVQSGNSAESAELLEFRLIAGFVDLYADLQIAVSFEELLQGVIVMGPMMRSRCLETIWNNSNQRSMETSVFL